MELARGDLAVPALVRAVRAVGVQAGLDLDLLADASIAAEMVARSWQDDASPEPLRVEIDGRPGDGLDLVFGFAHAGTAERVAEAGLTPGARGALRVLAAVEHAASGSASGLRLTFG